MSCSRKDWPRRSRSVRSLLRHHPLPGLRGGLAGPQGSRLQRRNHSGHLSPGVAHRRKLRPEFGKRAGLAVDLAHRRAVDRVRVEQAASQRDFRYGTTSLERDTDHVSDAVISDEERRQVTGCLGGLTDLQRECIELAYYQGLTYVGLPSACRPTSPQSSQGCVTPCVVCATA